MIAVATYPYRNQSQTQPNHTELKDRWKFAYDTDFIFMKWPKLWGWMPKGIGTILERISTDAGAWTFVDYINLPETTGLTRGQIRYRLKWLFKRGWIDIAVRHECKDVTPIDTNKTKKKALGKYSTKVWVKPLVSCYRKPCAKQFSLWLPERFVDRLIEKGNGWGGRRRGAGRPKKGENRDKNQPKPVEKSKWDKFLELHDNKSSVLLLQTPRSYYSSFLKKEKKAEQTPLSSKIFTPESISHSTQPTPTNRITSEEVPMRKVQTQTVKPIQPNLFPKNSVRAQNSSETDDEDENDPFTRPRRFFPTEPPYVPKGPAPLIPEFDEVPRVVRCPTTIPDRLADSAKVMLLIQSYNTEAHKLYGAKAPVAFGRSDFEKSKHYPRLVKAAQACVELEIAPSAWAEWRLKYAKRVGVSMGPTRVFNVATLHKLKDIYRDQADTAYGYQLKPERLHKEQQLRASEATARWKTGTEKEKDPAHMPFGVPVCDWYDAMRKDERKRGYLDPLELWPTRLAPKKRRRSP